MAYAITPNDSQIDYTIFGDSLGGDTENQSGLDLRGQDIGGRDPGNFRGFEANDRPGIGALSQIAPPSELRGGQLIVSDSRAVPNFHGETQIMGMPDNVTRFTAAQSIDTQVRPRLTSTLQSRFEGQRQFQNTDSGVFENRRKLDLPKGTVRPNSVSRFGKVSSAGRNLNPSERDQDQLDSQNQAHAQGRRLSTSAVTGLGDGDSGRRRDRGGILTQGLVRGIQNNHRAFGNSDQVQDHNQDGERYQNHRQGQEREQNGMNGQVFNEGGRNQGRGVYLNQGRSQIHGYGLNQAQNRGQIQDLGRGFNQGTNIPETRNSTPRNPQREIQTQVPMFRVNRAPITNRYVDPTRQNFNYGNNDQDDISVGEHNEQEAEDLNTSFHSIADRHIVPEVNRGRVEQHRLFQLQRDVYQNDRIRSQGRNEAEFPVFEPEVPDFRRRLGTEVMALLNKIRRTVDQVKNTMQEATNILQLEPPRYRDICSTITKIKGLLQVLTDLQYRAAPYVGLDSGVDIAETLFEISVSRPEWDSVISSLSSVKEDMERERNKSTNKEVAVKAVKVSYSEFPVFDGNGNYQDWWARWSQLGSASKLDKANLAIKLKESIVGMAEEIVGTSIMATGSYDQLLAKLTEVYCSPIDLRQVTALNFFNVNLDSESLLDVRRMVTRGQDALNRAYKAEMNIESLMANLLLANMPDYLRDKMVNQINITCPSYNMNMEIFNNAFVSATQSHRKPDAKTKLIGAYPGAVQKEEKPIQQYCVLHWPTQHSRLDCPIRVAAEAREYLASKNKCIACCRPKERHHGGCENVPNLFCRYHPGQFHHTYTCDGPDFTHPGCQFKDAKKK